MQNELIEIRKYGFFDGFTFFMHWFCSNLASSRIIQSCPPPTEAFSESFRDSTTNQLPYRKRREVQKQEAISPSCKNHGRNQEKATLLSCKQRLLIKSFSRPGRYFHIKSDWLCIRTALRWHVAYVTPHSSTKPQAGSNKSVWSASSASPFQIFSTSSLSAGYVR